MMVDDKNGIEKKLFIIILIFKYTIFTQYVFFINESIGVFDWMYELFIRTL